MKAIPRILTVAVAVLGLVATVATGPAAAHEGEGVVTVESATPEGTSVQYVVRLTWKNDGHAALDATLTASLYPPDATGSPPVQLTPIDQDGRYEGTLTFPNAGDYTVRFTGVRPEVTFDQTQNVPTPATTAAPATTTAEQETTTTQAGGDEDETAAPHQSDDSDDDSGFPWIPVAAAVVVLAGAAGAVVMVRRRQA